MHLLAKSDKKRSLVITQVGVFKQARCLFSTFCDETDPGDGNPVTEAEKFKGDNQAEK
jgi:hypothetical protein